MLPDILQEKKTALFHIEYLRLALITIIYFLINYIYKRCDL